MHQDIRQQEAQRVTLIGVAKNILLAFTKVIFGVIGQSQALIVDGLHSVADLLTDALVLIAAKYGSQRADNNHPYGHQRIETAATAALAVLLILTGLFIMVDSARVLFKAEYTQPKMMVLWVALAATLLNEGLFQITRKVGEKINSKLLIANAWHHRSDAASSLIVAIGIAGALLGYYYCDAIAALVVGVLIIKMGIKLAWSSIQELVDTGVDAPTLDKMRIIINSVPGVNAIHQLRNRGMAGAIYVDVHIQVNPYLTVSEGHYIAQQVHQTLVQKMPQVTDVTVHVDPEEDGAAAPCKTLPDRKGVLALLNKYWVALPASKSINDMQLHYLSGKINVEIRLPLAMLAAEKTAAQLQAEFDASITQLPQIASIKLWFG